MSIVTCSDPALKESICVLARSIPEVKSFPFSWTRWKNWERHPPIAFVDGGTVLGFSAATFSARSGYAYEYFIGVDPGARGRKIGWTLVDTMLSQAREKGMVRLKLKSEHRISHHFWASFGLKPFARNGKQLCWDADIKPVAGAGGLAEWMNHGLMHSPIPETAMRRWLASGATLMSAAEIEEALL